MPDYQPSLTREDVHLGIADCTAAGRRPGMRPVWRAIVARTGKRPSFSTVARFLAEIGDGAAPTPAPVTGPPDQIVAQVQQLAPAVWQAASAAARQELAAELQAHADRLRAAAERERDLLAELDEAQARAAAADEQRQEAVQRAAALHQHMDAQAASLQALAEAQRLATGQWATRERELSSRLSQLEREGATLAAAGHHAREALAQVTAARDRLDDELREAQRRADADLALNAHLREQLTTRDEDVRALQAEVAASTARERESAIAVAIFQRRAAHRDPLPGELRRSLARIEQRLVRRDGS
jgi:hypothetical protein